MVWAVSRTSSFGVAPSKPHDVSSQIGLINSRLANRRIVGRDLAKNGYEKSQTPCQT
jgi:hypothetical protein